MICIHQNGSRETLAERSNLSNNDKKSHDNIDISSITRTAVVENLFARYSREIKSSMSSSESVSRMPSPLHECMVIPPICVAAIPVEAVTATPILCS